MSSFFGGIDMKNDFLIFANIQVDRNQFELILNCHIYEV